MYFERNKRWRKPKGQSRGTYNIGHKTQIKDKQNKKTKQKTTKMSNMDPTQKTVGNRVAGRG